MSCAISLWQFGCVQSHIQTGIQHNSKHQTTLTTTASTDHMSDESGMLKKRQNKENKEATAWRVFEDSPPAQSYDDSHMGEHSARYATGRRLKEEEEEEEEEEL